MTRAAAPDATRAFAARHRASFDASAFRELGRTGLTVSALGFGCYRVDAEREPHVRALELALSSGVNLVDTSTNYTDGGSERAVALALSRLQERGVVTRDEIVVVTKIGYVQGTNLALARERDAAGRPFPELVRYAEGCWHCIHPEFLEDQLARSLQRLELERVDVVLLHNPEYFLSDAMKRAGGPLASRRDEFYRRVREAFRHLEREAEAGRIGWYGVSSNTFVVGEDEAEATSLQRMLDIAGDVAEEAGRPRDAHRFAVAQMPFNLVETGAALVRNNPGGRTALQVARDANVAVLVNRPLNAFSGVGLVRLADWPARAPGVDLGAAARDVAALEDEFERTIAPALERAAGSAPLFGWGRELGENAHRLRDALHWRQVESEYVRPRLEHAVAHVGLHLIGKIRNDWSDWRARYEPAVERLLGAVADLSRGPAQEESDALHRQIEPALPARWTGRSLSQQALGRLLGTAGVTSVLVGMREERWVRDALAALQEAPPPGIGGGTAR